MPDFKVAKGSPWLHTHVGRADATAGVEATDAITVAIQLGSQDGKPLTTKGAVLAYLSDDSGGNSLAASAPSGGVAAGTDGLVIPLVSGKCFLLVSEDDGDIDLVLTEATDKTFYLCIVLPSGEVDITAVNFD